MSFNSTALAIESCSYVLHIANTAYYNITYWLAALNATLVDLPNYEETAPIFVQDICSDGNKTATTWTGQSAVFNAACDLASSAFKQGADSIQQVVSEDVCPADPVSDKNQMTHFLVVAGIAAVACTLLVCFVFCSNIRVRTSMTEAFCSLFRTSASRANTLKGDPTVDDADDYRALPKDGDVLMDAHAQRLNPGRSPSPGTSPSGSFG